MINSLGPRFNFGWFETIATLLGSLHRNAGSECLLITGSRFPRWAKASGAAAYLNGLHVVEIDEVSLFRRLSAAGIMPTDLEKLLYAPDGADHPAVCILADEIDRKCGDFRPDVLVSFAVQTDFLAKLWPQAVRLHTEAGCFSRNPFPFSLFFDHLGMYRKSAIGRFGSRLRDCSATSDGRALADAFRRHHARALKAVDPFRSIDLRDRFKRLCLLPLQVSNYFSFDDQAGYRTQLDFVLDVLSSAPADVGVIVTEYLECGQILKTGGSGGSLDYLQSAFPNLMFLDQFRSFSSPSQYLTPRVDGVWTVSSNVGYQALLHDRLLGTPSGTHLADVAHSTTFEDFFARLGRVPAQGRGAFLAWQLQRYLVPAMLLQDGQWLHDYFQRRLQAIRADVDPIDAFVPIADAATLEEAWILKAPQPTITRFVSPGDSLEVQAILQSMSWRITAPLRALGAALRSCRDFLSSLIENVTRRLRAREIRRETASQSSKPPSPHGLLVPPRGEFQN